MDSQSKVEHLQNLDAQIQSNRSIVAIADDMEQLVNSQLFQKVIKKGYMEAEAIRITSLFADPSMQTPEKQAGLVVQLSAISHLQEFIRRTIRLGEQSRSSIADAQGAIAKINAEAE